MIVGDGPLSSGLMNQFGNGEVLWWGYEPDLDTRVALLQCAEVFVLPSLVEGLSLALLEAMASGTACVATDAGADGEALEGGAGIVLSTQGVTTQLRTLLPVLRDQPVLTAELGRRAPVSVPSSATPSAATSTPSKRSTGPWSAPTNGPPELSELPAALGSGDDGLHEGGAGSRLFKSTHSRNGGAAWRRHHVLQLSLIHI